MEQRRFSFLEISRKFISSRRKTVLEHATIFDARKTQKNHSDFKEKNAHFRNA
jgi:hypothetical protein